MSYYVISYDTILKVAEDDGPVLDLRPISVLRLWISQGLTQG